MSLRWFMACLITAIVLHALLPAQIMYSGIWWLQSFVVGVVAYVVANAFEEIR